MKWEMNGQVSMIAHITSNSSGNEEEDGLVVVEIVDFCNEIISHSFFNKYNHLFQPLQLVSLAIYTYI